MQDIADKLGVSRGTVSLVLSGKSKNRVSDALRDKILATATEMNYQINELARSLRTGYTNTIGVVVTDISNEYFGKLTFYIQEEAKKYGYLVLTVNSNENDKELSAIVRMLINKKVDGMIVVPTENCFDVLKNVVDAKIPLVQLDRFCPGLSVDYVGVNNYGTSVTAVKSLIDRGCRKIGMVNFSLNLTALKERSRGCIDTLKNNNILDESLIRDIDYGRQEMEIGRAMSDFVCAKNVVDAIYFTSRRVFAVGLKELMRLNIPFPKKIRVLCFDEVETLLSSPIQIDYIEQPIKDMGSKAFDLLLDKIRGSQENGNYLFEAKMKPSNIFENY